MPLYGTLPGIFTIKPERSLFLYSSTYIWAKVLAHMEQKLTDTIVTTWFDDTEVLELTDQKLVLYSPDCLPQGHDHLALRNLHQRRAQRALRHGLRARRARRYGNRSLSLFQKKPRFIEFNPQFTFDNFIVGNSNKFANAAAVAVAGKARGFV